MAVWNGSMKEPPENIDKSIWDWTMPSKSLQIPKNADHHSLDMGTLDCFTIFWEQRCLISRRVGLGTPMWSEDLAQCLFGIQTCNSMEVQGWSGGRKCISNTWSWQFYAFLSFYTVRGIPLLFGIPWVSPNSTSVFHGVPQVLEFHGHFWKWHGIPWPCHSASEIPNPL